MIIGIAATSLTFVAMVISLAAYYLYYRREDEQVLLNIARMSFYVATVLIFFQAALLMYGILNHKFEWSYVASYSSRDLSLYYLISTFWAGQEGTFLLWLVLGQIYGLFIIRANKENEPLVISLMGLVQAFILIILIKKNPFAYVWQVNPAVFQPGMIPADGNGLNPLLQDPWMTIHPPILFAGYSSTMILFAFAMTALIKRNYNKWVQSAYPYILFANLMLGAGIILGGYWAYTTLGWGGFWGWDPVENSSLIPWLTSLALLHGVIIQKKQGGLKKTNIFLALLTFILVLYGSFLTRSGVLTDFSVHSFGGSELDTYLLAFVFLFLGIATIAFLYRAREVESEKVQTVFLTRETFMFFGSLVLLILALLTFFGTSSPIFTGFFGKASNVSTSYYNTIAVPIAMLIAILIGVTPVLRWKRESPEQLKKLYIHAAISLLLGVVAYFLGLNKAVSLIIVILSVFAILVNGQIIYLIWSHKKYNFGGYLAHVGVGLMLIGIIISSVYDRSQKVKLPMGAEMSAMGYSLRYEGKIPAANGKDRVKIFVNNKPMFAKFYWSDYSRAYMVSPAVKNTVTKDLYISPIQIIPASQNPVNGDDIQLSKNKKQEFEKYYLQFTGYEMQQHGMEQGHISLAAVVKVYDKSGDSLATIKPRLIMEGNKKTLIPAQLPGTDRQVQIKGLNVDKGAIRLLVARDAVQPNPYAGKEVMAVEVTIKPLINILWMGTILMVVGFLLAMFQQKKKKVA